MRIELSAIVLDTSIQCRAAIDTAIVDEYADAMSGGAEFPPVELFGMDTKCWPADGWHRILAARKLGLADIDAHLWPGGRADALRAALRANAAHGHRRTNADKRRAVEIAIKEFGHLSSRAIAEMCGVGDQLVRMVRPDEPSRDSRNATVTTSDGRQYPARRATPDAATDTERLADSFRPIQESAVVVVGSVHLDARQAEPDLSAVDDDDLPSSNLGRLKRAWKDASRRDRQLFLDWIHRRKQ